jgi:DNA-binding protein HU-beta
MNKGDLISKIAESADITKAQATKVVDSFVSSITETLAKGDTLSLVGFGTFSVKDRAARVGRNPQTGAELQIKASKNPTFKPGKTLKDAVN